jgi:UDP-N-acetylglucosamine:LPS N-acetylglucosamine transferase
MAIIKELRGLHPHWNVAFASYGTGAETFRLRGEPVHDLDLPDQNPYLATLTKAVPLIQHEDPDVVVAHEEFSALPAARILGIPALFLSAWLPSPSSGVFVESLNYANRVVVLESPGLFATPPNVPSKSVFTGPMARQMAFSTHDRPQLREKLHLPADARVITVMGSGGLPEAKGALADPVCAAFSNLAGPKHLIWIAGSDADLLRVRLAGREDVTVHVFVDPIEQVLAASDLVITKGTRGATMDCVSAGVPSLSISFGTNPIDDLLVPRIRSNTSLQARAVDAATLLFHIERILRQPPLCDRSEFVTPNHVANVLAQQIVASLPSR